jgi:hypothetical protein
MQAMPVAVPVPSNALPPASTSESVPELNELEDLLYDLLATGTADPNVARHVLDATQAFLHEHARERKTQRQFVEFFEKHALPLRPERPNLLALPALDTRGRASEAPVLLPEPPRYEPLAIALSAADGGEAARTEPRRRDWAWLLALAAIGCTTALAIAGMLELQGELGRLHHEAAQNASLLEQLRSETQSLRVQVKDANEALQQNQRDTQLLLRAFSSPLNINSR